MRPVHWGHCGHVRKLGRRTTARSPGRTAAHGDCRGRLRPVVDVRQAGRLEWQRPGHGIAHHRAQCWGWICGRGSPLFGGEVFVKAVTMQRLSIRRKGLATRHIIGVALESKK